MILFLDKDEQVVRIQRSAQIKSLEHEQTFSDRYVSNTLHGEIGLMDESILNRIAYIAISSPDQPYKAQYFWLKDHKVEGNSLSFTGVDTGIEELSKTPVYDRRFKEYRADQIINELLKETNWGTGYVANTPRKQIQFYYMTVFDALKKLCEACDLEMQFFVETTANGIGRRYIEFKNKLGDNQGSRVVYGKNGIQITKEQERANLYTALIGRGKGEEVSTAEENAAKNDVDAEEARAGYGRKINFEEIVWSKAKGDPVDKPAGQQYVEIPEATEQYGYKGIDGQMHPKIGFIDFDEEKDRQALLQRTYNALKETAHPQVAFKTSATYLKGNICDTVRVIRPDLNFDYETRIFHIVWDRRIEDHPRAVTIEFGDSTVNQTLSQHISTSVGSQISQSFDALRESVGLQLDQQMTDYVKNADGTTNFYSPDDPRDTGKVPKLNDLWFKPDPDHEGETILYIWNGETWEELIRSTDTDLIKKEIENEIQPYWDAYDQQFNEWDKQTESKLEAFNQSVEDKLNGTYESTIAYLDQYDDEITQQVRDEMEQTRKELEFSIGKLVTPDEMNDQIDHMIDQAKAEMISSDELHASVNEAIANAKSDLLTPLQAHDMIEQALKDQGIDETEIRRLLDEYDDFVRVEDYQKWTEQKNQDIANAWQQATEGKAQADVALEMIGKPEHTEYGTNIVDGDTTVRSETGIVTVKSQHLLEKDKPYTLSFKLECLIPREANFTLNFKDNDSNVKQTDEQLPTADATIVIKHQANEPQQANFALNFKDNDSNVQQNNDSLPTGNATIVIKHS